MVLFFYRLFGSRQNRVQLVCYDLAETLVYFAYVLTKASGSASPERLTKAKKATTQTTVVAKPR